MIKELEALAEGIEEGGKTYGKTMQVIDSLFSRYKMPPELKQILKEVKAAGLDKKKNAELMEKLQKLQIKYAQKVPN